MAAHEAAVGSRRDLPRNLQRITIGSVFRAFGLSLIGPFLALYLHNVLGVGYAEVGILAAAVGIPPVAIAGVGGFLADRIGRRRLFLLAFFVEGASLVAAGFAMATHSLAGLLAAFVVAGIAGNVGGPAISAYVSDFATGMVRRRAFTWQRVGWNVGFAAGVTSGGVLLVLVGFPYVGWAAGAATLVGATYLALTLEPSPYDLGLARGSAASAAPTAARPGSVRDSLRILRRDAGFLWFCLAFALGTVTASQWNVTFALFSSGALHLPYSVLGLGFAVNGLVVVFGQVPTTELTSRRTNTTLAAAGTLAYALAFLGLGIAALLPAGAIVVFFVAVVVLTVGENLQSVAATTLPSNAAPPSEIGAYNGAFTTIWGIGGLVAIVFGGFALAAIHNPIVLWLVLCAPAVPALLLFGVAGRRLTPAANRP